MIKLNFTKRKSGHPPLGPSRLGSRAGQQPLGPAGMGWDHSQEALRGTSERPALEFITRGSPPLQALNSGWLQLGMLSTWGGSSRRAARGQLPRCLPRLNTEWGHLAAAVGSNRDAACSHPRHADSRLPSHSPGHPTAAGPWHHPPQPRLHQQPTLSGFWSHSPRRTSWRKLHRTCHQPACWSVIRPSGPLRTPGPPTRKHSHSSAAIAPAQPGGARGSPVAARKTVLCSSRGARFTFAVPVGNGEKPKHRAKMLGNQSLGRLPGVSGALSPGRIRV